MVNLGNFFGARGRAVDPNSDRQFAMACKAQGLVFDKDTKQCRAPLKRGRAPAPGADPSVASLRAACKAQGLVLDLDSKQCRKSRRGAGLAAARTARAAARTLAGPTQKDMMAMCKAQGLVFDRDTKQCRPKKVRGSALEEAYKRGSIFAFGARGRAVDPMSARQLAMACKAQGLVLDMDTKACRESRRGAGLAAARTARAAKSVLAGPTQKDMMAACKAQGLVFDRDTKQCRPKKVRGSALEQAYARGSLFFGKNKFGVNRPAGHQRAGIVYSGPASALTGPDYGIIGPVAGSITGPESFLVRGSTVSPAMMKELGVSTPKIPTNSAAKKPAAKKPDAKKIRPGVPTPKFGTYTRGPKGM